MASGTFIFFKADTSMITHKGWFGSWDHPFNAGLAQEMTADSPRISLFNAIGFQKLSSSSHSLTQLNTSEEAGGRNVFNPIDLLKLSKDSQLQQIKLLPSALQKGPP